MKSGITFDPACRLCPRLASNLARLRREFPAYHNAPVPSFGDPKASLLIVGLAPGMHGANATGRPFTGDFAGILLYRTLYAAGLSTRCESKSADDPLRLVGCRITNAVKCLPPANKPTTDEIRTCNEYLHNELEAFPRSGVILALGAIAHRAVLLARGQKQSRYPFAHGAMHELPCGMLLIDSYHCSRYNTQTGRLTQKMFEDLVALAKSRVEARA